MPGGPVPPLELVYRVAREPAPADHELCERLIGAYARASAEAAELSGMWTDEVFARRQRALREALEQRDPGRLAVLLGSMFRSDFVLGMAGGSMGAQRKPRALERLACLFMLSRLVALGEAVGAVRAESQEQRSEEDSLTPGRLREIVERIESALGTSLDFPDVGANYGLDVAGRLVTFDSLDQAYAAIRVRGAIDQHLAARESVGIAEIGGGYGGLAYWLMRTTTSTGYHLVDLPIVNVLQGYFLAETLGFDAVSLYGEPASRVSVLPTHALAEIATPVAAVINKDSLPEIDADAARGYLAWILGSCDGVFYSYNHEAATPFGGTSQNVVSEMLGELRPVRRDRSWVRRGYVEEVYLPARGPAAGASAPSP